MTGKKVTNISVGDIVMLKSLHGPDGIVDHVYDDYRIGSVHVNWRSITGGLICQVIEKEKLVFVMRHEGTGMTIENILDG